MIIAGAGLAGLISGALLRDECKEIWEAKPSLPDNHAALLRFKSSIVGDSLNIPFKPVTILKDVDSCGNDLKDVMQYSKKTNRSYLVRSIKKEISQRFIAPENFPEQLQRKVMAPIKFGTQFQDAYYFSKDTPIISTIPMPILLKELDATHKFEAQFRHLSGQVISVNIKNCDVYCTMYFPNPGAKPYRVSITGSKMIIEFAGDEQVEAEHEICFCCSKLGIEFEDIMHETISYKYQPFMKILPMDEETRKRIILFLTEEFNIYSFGRFATWRPGLLLDDLIKDLRVIQKIVQSKHTYDERKKS